LFLNNRENLTKNHDDLLDSERKTEKMNFKRVFVLVSLTLIVSCFQVLYSIDRIETFEIDKHKKNITCEDGNKRSDLLYDTARIKESPLIFIGGYARSGTTLMRAVLDVHESISCGKLN
jgi:hypothetical protein